MAMESDKRYSRPMSAADRLGEAALDRHKFMSKQVLLTGEREMLSTANGRECLLDSLRLLIRICMNVSVYLPGGFDDLLNESRSISDRINFGSITLFSTDPPDFKQFDAILSIGSEAKSDLPWTVINSNGWLVRVSSSATGLAWDSGQENPIAALAAAGLGVSEVFKRLLRVKEERGRFFHNLTFSLFNYDTGVSDPGPPLPKPIQLDSLLLIGVGAIGNGIVHLLNQLTVQGDLRILDKQVFQPENLGTCLLIGPSDVDKEKALFAEELLRGKLSAKGYHEDLSEFKKRLGSEMRYPSIVLNALDNIPARHAAQDLWPNIIIDGAISDFGCQVSRHLWGEDIACLKCIFRENSQSAEKQASSATGLQESRTRQAFEAVTEQDVVTAPIEKKDWLKERIGKQICSVIQEGMALKISSDEQNASFEPSVPFVACLSASMVVAELVKYSCRWESPLEPRFQFDVLRGPVHGQLFPQSRRRECICVERGASIDKIKLMRRTKQENF